MESPYDVLGVAPDAAEGALDAAYRRRVKETHPDQGGSADEFRRVVAAYEAIKAGEAAPDDPEARQVDGAGAGGSGGGGGGGAARGSADGTTAGSADGTTAGTPGGGTDPAPSVSRVEYLDYDVLADFGWSLDDPDLFEKAAAADLDRTAHGSFSVSPGASVLEAAEDCGLAWPFACRGGACANCAVALTDGEMTQPSDTVLPEEMADRGVRLSCNGHPVTDELRVVYNLKHLPELEELRLPPYPFERSNPAD